MTATENLGPHLLGRRPSAPDARDYPLALWLKTTTPLEDALKALLTTPGAARTTKTWCQLATPLILGGVPSPAPVPVPPAPSVAVTWADDEPVLDQGQTPHCVGFGGAQWGNTLPVDDKFTNAHGDAIYYECKVIDGEPLAEDGSDVRSLATALRNRKRLSTYAFAATVDEACAWVLQHGPVIIGSDWMDDMFTPDAQGFVYPTGGVAGGHCYLLLGYDGADTLTFLNSWSGDWGVNGRFKMRKAEFASLWAHQGEALAAVELP